MSYIIFEINGNQEFSRFVKSLKVATAATYTAQTNAAGNRVIDYINEKRTIEVGFRPMLVAQAAAILQEAQKFSCAISFYNPDTGDKAYNVACICPSREIDFYTFQDAADKRITNEFSLTFEEL